MSMLSTARRTVRTALSIAEDVLFDARYGVETRQKVSAADVGPVVGVHAAGGRDYHPTRGRHLRKLWQALDVPPGLGLLDIGCGKGLVLLRSATEPFSRIVGARYAASLLEVAEANRAQFIVRYGRAEFVVYRNAR